MCELGELISNIGFEICHTKLRTKMYRYKTNIISIYHLLNDQEYQLLFYEDVPLDFNFIEFDLEYEDYFANYIEYVDINEKSIKFENFISNKFISDIRKIKINILLDV